MHIVLQVVAEGGVACARLRGEAGLFALLVDVVYGAAHGAGLVALVVEVARLLIPSVEVGHLVLAVGELAHQLSVEVVEVQVVVVVALALQDEIVRVEADVLVGGLIDVGGRLLAQHQLAYGRARIGHVHVHATLVAVEGDDGQLLGVGGEVYAGDVVLLVNLQVHLAGHLRLDVVGVYAHLRVVHSGQRILVGVGTGVEGVGLMAGSHAAIHGEGERGHVALYALHIGYHLAVGAELIALVHGELLLVHPVGDAVEHLVELAVGSHLRLAVAKHQLH